MAIISKVLQPGVDAPPLSGFALAWRWEPGGRHPLPPEVLAGLQPLTRAQAQSAFRISCALVQDGHLDPAWQAMPCQGATPPASAPVSAWLQARGPRARTRVWLSWEPDLALCTCWGLFAQHWQAFCYPGSDDLVVFPASRRWVLVHHHTQRLEFSRRPGARSAASLRKASGRLQDTPASPAG